VGTARLRQQSLSWFMKCLKESLARLANRQDQTRGAFFEGRFKSVAILDEEALLATCVSIDLNPLAVGLGRVPEANAHTSIKERVDHVKAQARCDDLEAARNGSVAGSAWTSGLEEALWLCPLEDRRGLDSSREGMLQGSRWEAIGSWSITRPASSGTARPRWRGKCQSFSIAWDRTGGVGNRGWKD